MSDEQQRFKVGDSVIIADLSSPFYDWKGTVRAIIHNPNGWPYYHVQSYRRTGYKLDLTFSDPQLEKADG